MHPSKKAAHDTLEVLGHVAKRMRTDRLRSKFPKPPAPEATEAPGDEPDGDADDESARAAKLAKLRTVYGHLKPKE